MRLSEFRKIIRQLQASGGPGEPKLAQTAEKLGMTKETVDRISKSPAFRPETRHSK